VGVGEAAGGREGGRMSGRARTAARAVRPARASAAPARSRAAAPASAPSRAPARRPAPATQPPRPRSRAATAKRSRRSTLAFVVTVGVVACGMILGLVALQALLAQTSFKVDDLQTRLSTLRQTEQERTIIAARLASPPRIEAE